jgi:hypothetical protein
MLKIDFFDLNKNGEIGDWAFSEDNLDIYLLYPIQISYEGEPPIKDVVRIPVCRENEKYPRKETPWAWNGSMKSPTVTPSINVIGRWHGFLTDGKLITV